MSLQLRRNVLAGPVASIVNAALLALTYPIYLHYLGYERVGVWLLLSAVVAVVQVMNLGLGPALTSLVAEAQGREDYTAIANYTSTTIALLSIAGILATAFLAALSDQILGVARLSASELNVARSLLPWAGLMSTLALTAQAMTATLTGLGRMDLAAVVESGGRASSLGLSVVLLVMGQGVEALLIGTAVAHLGVTAVAGALSSHLGSGRPILAGRITREGLGVLWVRSRGLMAGSIFTMMLHPFNRFAVARWGGIAQVPVYEVAFAGAYQLRAVFESGVRALAPEVGRLTGVLGASAAESIRGLQRRFSRLIMLAGIPTWLLVAAIAEPLLQLWLRDRYRPDMLGAFRIMLVSSFFSLLAVPAFYVAVGLGRSRIVALGQLLMAALSVTLVCGMGLLTGQLTPLQAAMAFALATGASALYYERAVKALLVAPIRSPA